MTPTREQIAEMGPVTIEGPTLPDLRWAVSPRNDSERVLQQAIRMQCGSRHWIEWRNVPEVVLPLAGEAAK